MRRENVDGLIKKLTATIRSTIDEEWLDFELSPSFLLARQEVIELIVDRFDPLHDEGQDENITNGELERQATRLVDQLIASRPGLQLRFAALLLDVAGRHPSTQVVKPNLSVVDVEG